MRLAPRGRRCLYAIVAGLAVALSLLSPPSTIAGEERYDYDALGRLVRVIDEQGRVTEYVYDAAGNLLQVITGGAAQAPAVSAYTPTSIRRGETRAVQIDGSGFDAARVAVSGTGLAISALSVGASQITFNFAADSAATLGPAGISITNSAGSASVSILVNPVLPKLALSPQPVALTPSDAPRSYTVSLSSADGVEHVVAVASANGAVASVTPSSLTFAPGETAKTITVTPQALGVTAISLTSATLGNVSAPVYVATPLAGSNLVYSAVVGVLLQQAPGTANVGPVAAPLLGVARGAYISGVAPRDLPAGSGPHTVVISGNDFAGVTALAVTPPAGITLGAFSIAPDGRSISVPLTLAVGAVPDIRRFVLTGPLQPYVGIPPNADTFLVARAVPTMESVDPIFAVTGTTGATLTIRGANLHAARSVSVTPPDGISVGAFPAVSADGRTLTVDFSVASFAATGPRVVRVTTPGGTSDAVGGSTNTLLVVNEVLATYRPIYSAPVGVVLQSAPQQVPSLTFATQVGVAFGRTGISLAPLSATAGQTISLTISGYELGGVTAVQMTPADGLTIGAPVASPDGLSVTVSVEIAPGAPATLRAVRPLVGTAIVPFTNEAAAQFRVLP